MALSPIIEIKKPCYENWDSMNPRDKGRFCMNCEKVVTDFTNNTPEEIYTILKQNNLALTCGQFNAKDVITESKIDKLIWKLNTSGFKRFSLLALGILILIGCRTRRIKGMYSNYSQNPKTLDEIPTIINNKINNADTLKK